MELEKKRKGISKSIRFDVFKRDSFKCQYCGKSAPEVILEIDHIIPISKKGDNKIINLITACFDCNRGKSNKKLDDKHIAKKQKKTLEDLNEKKIQLEWFLQWKKELLSLDNVIFDKINEILDENEIMELSLTDKSHVKKILKKYSMSDFLEALYIAIENGINNKIIIYTQGVLNHKNNNNNNKKIPEFYYIRKTLTNRFDDIPYSYESRLEKLCSMEIFIQNHEIIEIFKDYAKKCINISSFDNEVKILLNKITEVEENES